MSKEYQHILEDVLALPKKERFSLIQVVLGQLEQEIDANEPWETGELFEELDNRLDEIKSGKVHAIPGGEFMDKLDHHFSSK